MSEIDHAELKRLAEIATTVDPIGPGWYTYADLARWMEPCDARLVEQITPAAVLALIAENEGLRVVVERVSEKSMEQTDKLLAMHARATEAERKLAEARGLLREARGDLVATAEANTPEWSRRVYESSRADYEQDMDLPNRIRDFIASLSSKEAERG